LGAQQPPLCRAAAIAGVTDLSRPISSSDAVDAFRVSMPTGFSRTTVARTVTLLPLAMCRFRLLVVRLHLVVVLVSASSSSLLLSPQIPLRTPLPLPLLPPRRELGRFQGGEAMQDDAPLRTSTVVRVV